jgi:mRNA interferase HigB
MRIISKSTLRQFWDNYPSAKDSLLAWHEEVLKADWATPQQLKIQLKTMDSSLRWNDDISVNYKKHI